MKRSTKIAVSLLAAAAAAGGATGIAVATGGDDTEAPISGAAFDKATVAALAHIGSGRVTETEVGNEDSYYEVEVTLDDGRQVDVQLDRDFKVVSSEADDDLGEEDGAGDDDASETG